MVVRVGLIGTGFGVKVQLPGLLQVPGVEVTAICSAQIDRARGVADEFHLPHATDDYRELISRDDVDLVSVCVPPLLHEEMTIAALGANKHVLCEKPLAPGLDESVRMEAAAVAANVVHAVDHTERFMPYRRYLHDLVADGFLGEIRLVQVSVNRTYVTDPRTEPHWFTWVSEKSKGGGLLASLLSHHLDLTRYTFGVISEVSGWTAITVPDRPVLPWDFRDGDKLGADIDPVGRRAVDVEDTVVAFGRIGNGLFTLSSTWAGHHGSGVRVEAYGSEGTLVLEPDGTILGASSKGGALAEMKPPVSYALPYAGAQKQIPTFAKLMENLAGTIEGTEEPVFASFSDGVAVQRIMSAIEERRPVEAVGADVGQASQ